MSVHSLANVDDNSYTGYKITKDGDVVEFYDHRDDPESSLGGARPLIAQPHSGIASSHRTAHTPKVKVTKTGCCDGCIGCLGTLGRLPYPSALCLMLLWVGTGLFCGCGMALMDETLSLYKEYGPAIGNPFSDPEPEYLFYGSSDNTEQVGYYELRNKEDLGNRVPPVFRSLRYSLYAVIPFMVVYSIILVMDGHKSTYELRHVDRGCKSSSIGICCSLSLLFCSYWLLIFFIVFLCFTTLAVYYYRVVMLRCYDLNDRGYNLGTQKNICLDLVQFGLIMYKDTTDPDFGKICGPGDSSRSTVGQLKAYCENYTTAWRFSLLTFAGCFLIIFGLIHSVMILSSNYSSLKTKFLQPHLPTPPSVHMVPSPANTRKTNFSGYSAVRSNGIPPIVVGTNGGDVRPRRASRDFDADSRPRKSSRDFDADSRPRRSSRDIELDYIDDNSHRGGGYPASNYTRELDKNSHVGVDYYYRPY